MVVEISLSYYHGTNNLSSNNIVVICLSSTICINYFIVMARLRPLPPLCNSTPSHESIEHLISSSSAFITEINRQLLITSLESAKFTKSANFLSQVVPAAALAPEERFKM